MPEVRTLMTGLVFGESPRWRDNRLYGFDIATHEVFAVDLAGNAEVIAREPSGLASIGFLEDALLVAQRSGLIRRRQADSSFVAYADLASLSDKPWNDMVIDGRGNLYIGNIGFDFPGGEFRPGLVALVAPDGSARQVADETAFANGMVVTPDNSTLIVAETYAHRLTAFDVGIDGSLSNRRVWAELPDSFPDGITLDSDGAVWYADVPGKRCARVAEGGGVLQTIELDRGCFACALGGPNGATLFMLAAEYPPTSWGSEAARTGQVLVAQAPAPRAGDSGLRSSRIKSPICRWGASVRATTTGAMSLHAAPSTT